MMQSRLKKHSLKFLALCLSLFLWAYVLNSEKVRFEKTVQLDYILPEEMIFESNPPGEVTFLIEGPRAFVRTVAEREDRLLIDLNRNNLKRELKFHVDVNASQLTLPFGMKVDRVLPKRLSISLEKRASKILPVRIQLTGSTQSKLNGLKQELIPSEVEVYGPRSVLAKIKELYIRPLDVEILTGQDVVPVEILLPDDRLTLVTGQNVNLKFELKAQGSHITLKDMPVKFLTNSSKMTASTSKASVKLFIPDRMIKSRANISSSVQVWADIPEDLKGNIEVPLRVIIPQGVQLIEVSPKSIVVNVR